MRHIELQRPNNIDQSEKMTNHPSIDQIRIRLLLHETLRFTHRNTQNNLWNEEVIAMKAFQRLNLYCIQNLHVIFYTSIIQTRFISKHISKLYFNKYNIRTKKKQMSLKIKKNVFFFLVLESFSI